MNEQSYKIYMHRNKINNKVYIGLTKQKVEDRWRHDGLGYKNCPKFWNAIQKYGWDNFEHIILLENLTEEEASKKEIELIQQYDSVNNGYNLSLGGSTTNHSQETLEKMRQSMLGKKHTQETKDKISKSKDNVKLSVKNITDNIIYESIREAARLTGIDAGSIIKCCKGETYTAGKKEWEYVNEELKNTYNEIKEQKGKDKRLQKVLCVEKNKIYNTVSEASEDTGADKSNIAKCCRGKYKTAGGYTWKYIFD